MMWRSSAGAGKFSVQYALRSACSIHFNI